ncbi:hypothetical protein HYPDE_33448 [Hyphomicrobium denitrificans 1NES1]|uniref:Uncharacterized protein n=1 Tax=Hyphomicrobium denitrificans 1NES1 TaxID=670307 RepID=N0B7Y2_9HYPH|nr:hypothetical protein HYPDE_33448 [Hyphomicrobium denitrificans 1NES1]
MAIGFGGLGQVDGLSRAASRLGGNAQVLGAAPIVSTRVVDIR